MIRTQVQLAGALVASFLIAAPAAAADYCLDVSGVQFVAKGFKIPGKGKCKSVAGFCSTCGESNNSVAGSACTAADGSHARFALTLVTAATASATELIRLQVELPSGAATGSGINLRGGMLPFAFGLVGTGAKCPDPVPVP